MSVERIQEKLSILADAAKYDVSCSSSGSNRKNLIRVWEPLAMEFVMLTQRMGAVFLY